MRKGFALVSVLIMLVVLMSLLTAYFTLTRIELGATQASVRQTTGFYAAEAGLNLRAEEVRARFLGYGRPSGTSPSGSNPCQGDNQGSGDFACKTYTISGRTVRTYMVEDQRNPQTVLIPPGELFENLEAQEYRYSLFSEAIGPDGRTEAVLELVFKSRLVPMFQFAAFYDKDLEILPSPPMTLNGRVHTNGDLYLNANTTLTIEGQVSTTGRLYRGRKESNRCVGTVSVRTAQGNDLALACNDDNSRREYRQEDVVPWGGRIQVGVNRVTVPPPEELDPDPSKTYWQKADLRLALDLNGPQMQYKVYQVQGGNNILNVAATQALTSEACAGAVGTSGGFFNWRERKLIRMLEVDLRKLLDCVHSNPAAFGFSLDDTTEGGLVFHFTVFGPNSGQVNNYGVRIKNGAEIAATLSDAPRPRGLTIITDQAVYIQGDFNRTNWIPAAFLADSLNILSNAWTDDSRSYRTLNERVASDTEVNAAFLAGTDITGDAEGPAGQDRGNYNGGLENYPRFHENWTEKTLTYRGSFVSLGTPRHVNGRWCGTGGSGTYDLNTNQINNRNGCNIYNPPNRNWSYDVRFSQGQLPPLSPRFVYLKQERFLREFERP